ncbi:hypothetical protein EG328_006741 [Venturia inaequalis]|uniref:DUF7918 domain-containing protein n=1 Tax=Venturia inaequalis TaxID=5025 RepID=A0A8H3ZB39_VENIN|nr:hypothetical protein EG328_006741 [Venturia inaequalis]
MAVFPDLPGYEAKIVVDGVECAEYPAPDDLDEDDPNLVTKYIEATPGAKFQIHIYVRPGARALRKNGVCALVVADGQSIQEPLWRKRQSSSEAYIIEGFEEKSATGWQSRDLMFSVLATDDNTAHKISEELKQQIDTLGEIRIEFYRINVKRPTTAPSTEWTDRTETIPEKALKGRAISQKIGLSSTAKVITEPICLSLTYIDGRESPFATICFRYRSLNDLKAELIIPRSPSPVPLEDRPLESLTLEEMLELLIRQREQAASLRQENTRIKRERVSSPVTAHEDDEDLSIVKPTPKRRRIAATVDLIDD